MIFWGEGKEYFVQYFSQEKELTLFDSLSELAKDDSREISG